jgi:hypothetical protein
MLPNQGMLLQGLYYRPMGQMTHGPADPTAAPSPSLSMLCGGCTYMQRLRGAQCLLALLDYEGPSNILLGLVRDMHATTLSFGFNLAF